MKVSIQNAKFTHIKQIMEINQNSLPENYNKEYWDKTFYEGKEHSFVALWAGKVIGYIFCDQEYIISFAIEDKFRGKGIGKQLLYCCLNTFKTVKLHVRVNNTNAINLYKTVGFTENEKLSDYYLDPVEPQNSSNSFAPPSGKGEDGYEMLWKSNGKLYDVKKNITITL